MSTLAIFRESLVNALLGSLNANLQRYLQDDVWIGDISTKSTGEIPTNFEVSDSFSLDPPKDGDHRDIENAIHLHRELKRLTPLQARDPRLWTRLSHVEFWNYMRLRWPVERHMENRDRAIRFIASRYFIAQRQSRALLRHGIARLWWTAQLSHDPDRDNPYELTSVLLSTLDITQQIVERGMGRAPNIIKGFLEFLRQNREILLTGGNANRARIRRLAIHLNMCGGVSLLDLLSQGEVMELLSAELQRIIEAEEREMENQEVIVQ